jgi:predicted RNase H-like HicB family nuclease
MSTVLVESGTEFPALEAHGQTGRRVFLVVVERGRNSWGAYVPDLDGVVAAADTEEEVRSLISEAVEFHLEALKESHEPVPEPASSAHWVSG